mmetsp:Transcript_19827/g.35256  ORF Transcript_19827/g.35256 Transcript_19827/m.35256 type:complete len:229 (-) Transcript_19827:42-728(-)
MGSSKDGGGGSDKLGVAERKELDGMRETLFKDVDEMIATRLPAKIMGLTKVLEESKAKRDAGDFSWKEEDLRRYAENPDERVPVNETVRDNIIVLKNEIIDLLNQLEQLRLWVRLCMPRIEDGNNFGVEVQTEVVSMLTQLYSSGLSFLHNLTLFFSKRAKLITNMRKRPNVHEYAVAVRDLDDKQFVNTVQSCCDLRNHYVYIYDKIVKNREKLQRPKGNASSITMY